MISYEFRHWIQTLIGAVKDFPWAPSPSDSATALRAFGGSFPGYRAVRRPKLQPSPARAGRVRPAAQHTQPHLIAGMTTIIFPSHRMDDCDEIEQSRRPPAGADEAPPPRRFRRGAARQASTAPRTRDVLRRPGVSGRPARGGGSSRGPGCAARRAPAARPP